MAKKSLTAKQSLTVAEDIVDMLDTFVEYDHDDPHSAEVRAFLVNEDGTLHQERWATLLTFVSIWMASDPVAFEIFKRAQRLFLEGRPH